MKKSTILKLIALLLMTMGLVFIMFKVEGQGIKNEENIDVTKTDVLQEQRKLDSLRMLKDNEQKELERIRKEREFLQKFPTKKEIRKIKFK